MCRLFFKKSSVGLNDFGRENDDNEIRKWNAQCWF